MDRLLIVLCEVDDLHIDRVEFLVGSPRRDVDPLIEEGASKLRDLVALGDQFLVGLVSLIDLDGHRWFVAECFLRCCLGGAQTVGGHHDVNRVIVVDPDSSEARVGVESVPQRASGFQHHPVGFRCWVREDRRVIGVRWLRAGGYTPKLHRQRQR